MKVLRDPPALLLAAGALGLALGLLLALRDLPPGALASRARLPLSTALLLGLGGTLFALGIAARLPGGVAGSGAEIPLGRHRDVIGLLAVVVLLTNSLTLPLVALGLPPRSPALILIASTVQSLAFIGAVWLRVVRPGLITWRDMGFTGEGVRSALSYALPGASLILLLNVVTGAILARLGVEQTQLALFEPLRQLPPAGYALAVLIASLLVPVAEEIFFRGYVFTAYRRRYSPLVAALLSTALFALLHLNLEALVPIFVLGLVLVLLYHWTGSLLPGIAAHGINNALVFVLFYTVPR